GDLPEELEGVRLRLNRITLRVVDPADHLDLARLHLHRLPLPLRFDERSPDHHGASARQPEDFALVVGQVSGGNDLERRYRRAVVDLDEGQPGLRIAPGTDPPFDPDVRAQRDPATEDVDNAGALLR